MFQSNLPTINSTSGYVSVMCSVKRLIAAEKPLGFFKRGQISLQIISTQLNAILPSFQIDGFYEKIEREGKMPIVAALYTVHL